jgi:MFS family permease
VGDRRVACADAIGDPRSANSRGEGSVVSESTAPAAMVYPPARIAWYTMAVLGLLYAFSMIDRQIPNLLLVYIRRDLNISDTMVSLLAGFAFALFYATSALPISRIADQWSRKSVIFIGVVLWSLMTCLCGLSSSFVQFFIARMGVGLGEASLTPSAFAMASELFPPHKQARATSVFSIGPAIGGGLSLIMGGVLIGLAERAGPIVLPIVGSLKVWQIVLIAIGLLTLLTTVPLSAIHDPVRYTRSRPGIANPANPSISAVLLALWHGRGGFVPLFFGVPLLSMAAYGIAAWTPTYFIRVYGWNAHDTGIIFGAVQIVAGIASALVAAWISDRTRAAGRLDAPFLVLLVLLVAVIPLPLALAAFPDPRVGLAMVALMNLAISPVACLAPVALQAITRDGMRAQVTALFLLITNIVGIGLGPTVVAATTDFVFRNPNAVGWSMGVVGSAAYALSASILYLGRRFYRTEVEKGD